MINNETPMEGSDDSKDQNIETQPPNAKMAEVESPVLDIHVKQKHENKEPFQCEICNISFSQKYNMVNHIESVHGENTVGPTGAGHEEKNSLNENQEIVNDQISDPKDTKNSHEIKKRSNKTLKRRFTSQGKGVKEISSSKKARLEKKHPCPVCDEIFSQRKEMINHILSQHDHSTISQSESDWVEKLLETSVYKTRKEIIQKYGYSHIFDIWFQEESFFSYWQVHFNGCGVPLYKIKLEKSRKMRVKKFKKELLARSEKINIKKNTATRFQCSYCACNYAKKTTLNAHVKKSMKKTGNWKLHQKILLANFNVPIVKTITHRNTL